jgi:hypothetical protein
MANGTEQPVRVAQDAFDGQRQESDQDRHEAF